MAVMRTVCYCVEAQIGQQEDCWRKWTSSANEKCTWQKSHYRAMIQLSCASIFCSVKGLKNDQIQKQLTLISSGLRFRDRCSSKSRTSSGPQTGVPPLCRSDRCLPLKFSFSGHSKDHILIIWTNLAGGVDLSLDVSEIEGLSEDELRRRYDARSRGSAGVPMQGLAKDVAKKVEAICECGKKDVILRVSQ